MTDSVMAVRCSSKCLLEMLNHAPFLYTNEIESMASLCFRAFENYQAQHQVAVPAVPAAPAALQLPHAGVQPQHQLAVLVNSVQVHTSAAPEQAAVQLHVDPDNASALLVTNASQEHHQPSSFGNQLLNNNDDQHQFDLEFPPINIHKR
ncbi:hypothetical protein HCN44_008839 [Aphidius gifuensis]|uniref:Uncharacterized protein n=1 Tax=Aphidius gifuensis TaxID=684658 RepID=A0A834Y6Y2_APHGI|nr:hypothetical protein HCN44_008839 [Aphidius gifuensis]